MALVVPAAAVGVGDGQVADSPVVLVVQADGVLDLAPTGHDRVGALAVAVNNDWFSLGAGTLGMQFPNKATTRSEQDLLAGLELNAFKSGERFPG